MPWRWWRRYRQPETCPSEARQLLERVRAQQTEVDSLTSRMLTERETNHFREALQAVIRGQV